MLDINKRDLMIFNRDNYKFYSQLSFENSIEILNNFFNKLYSDVNYCNQDESKCFIELYHRGQKLKITFQVNKLDSSEKMIYQIIHKKVIKIKN
jgi:hypothetical protein